MKESSQRLVSRVWLESVGGSKRPKAETLRGPNKGQVVGVTLKPTRSHKHVDWAPSSKRDSHEGHASNPPSGLPKKSPTSQWAVLSR
ncbi:hypothetical protein HAX54_051492, partial [Datura stramonium]|nr:hypothetical protein [Datura stramonium]